MDVQTESVDLPPSESQSSGKIRKGFKLFGKRKPGNIFSIRGKGDGNNKSPVIRSKTADGLSETTAPDLEQEPDKENGKEVSQGERDQAEEEALDEDGVLSAIDARTSISSACSAKSLSFLSLLRGGRRGVGDRRVHTVSQPVGRQRRGLKGLFGNVKFRSKDKEDKEEVPPSPLLMSSRANSVEIIKEDLTLTPKSLPRSLDSPETESCEPMSLTIQDSTATSPSETVTPHATAGNVSRTNEHVSPLPTYEPPMMLGDNSLSSLLADISSLLTFESISGGDIMADVEAEWGKASSAISTVVNEVTSSSTSLYSKPTISSPLTSTSVSTVPAVKPSPVAIPTMSSTQCFTPLTKTTSTSSPIGKPSTIITTLTKTSTQTTQSVKLSSDSYKSTPTPTTRALSTTPITLSSFSTPVMSSSSITIKSTLSTTCAATTAPPNTPATIVKAPSNSPTLTSSASKLASEIAAPSPVIDSDRKPSPVATPPAASAKPPPVTHSPPIAVAFTQPPPTKLDSACSLNSQTSPPYKPLISSAAGESKAPVTVSSASTVTTKPSSPAPTMAAKMTTLPTSTPTSSSAFAALSQPSATSGPMDLTKTPPSFVIVPDLCPSSTPSAKIKIQPSPASAPPPSSTYLDKIPPTPSPASVVSLTPTPAPTTPAGVSTAQPTPPALGQIPVSQSKTPPIPAQIPVSVTKDPPAPAQIQVSQPKAPPEPTPALSPCSETSPSSPTAPWPSEAPTSAKTRGSGQSSVDRQLPDPSSTGAQMGTLKTEELHSQSRTSLQGPARESRIPQAKTSGLSKIPVVGGGRAGKLPVRESQHVDDEVRRDPPTPVLEERPHFNSHDSGSKDKICDVDANVLTLKNTQQESQQLPQPKVLTSLPRDSKIPVKHGAQAHTASQIPQAKEPPRTKIPVSKVPVRRVGNKPAGGGTQIRK